MEWLNGRNRWFADALALCEQVADSTPVFVTAPR